MVAPLVELLGDLEERLAPRGDLDPLPCLVGSSPRGLPEPGLEKLPNPRISIGCLFSKFIRDLCSADRRAAAR
jgi:hypothetical protein